MNFSKRIFVYIKITRPINVVITFLVVIVAILISEKKQTELIVLILAPLAAALTAAAGNIVNDIYDIETDRISHPNRILVLESLSITEAWIEFWILNSLSVFIAIYLSPILLIIVLITIFLLYIYSAFLKRLPLIGNIIIALITGLAFIYGGYAVGNPEAAIIPAVFAFLINFIREIVKDMEDVEGDTKAGVITFPIKFGFQKSKIVILLITFSLILFTLYPFITKLYKIEYFIVVMVFVNPLLILCLKFLFDSKIEKSLPVVSNILKLNMILGLIAIYLGR
jgi:geranylgeranylglycerol-phosphate geranylgeranyltransferase